MYLSFLGYIKAGMFIADPKVPAVVNLSHFTLSYLCLWMTPKCSMSETIPLDQHSDEIWLREAGVLRLPPAPSSETTLNLSVQNR